MLGLGLVLYAVEGYRRGLARTVARAIGLTVGGLLTLRFAPDLMSEVAPDLERIPMLVLLVALVLLGAAVGAGIMAWPVRAVLRDRAGASGRIDALLGGVASVVLAAAVAWLGAGVLRSGAPGPVVDVVDGSRVLRVVDDAAPVPRDDVLDRVVALFDQYHFPRVFEGGENPTPVEPADPAVAGDDAVTRAGASVVRIDATATQCRRMQEGSGFVVAPGLIVTNAHVVSGSSRVDIRKDRLRSKAEVVAFDPERDLAVLTANTGDLAALPLADTEVGRGEDGAVAGYPVGGPFRIEPARVRALVTARGRDIYDDGTAVRAIYALRAEIEPGNSGGPFLTRDGSVAGVVFARSYEDASTAYALRLDELRPVLDEAQPRTPVPVGGCTVG